MNILTRYIARRLAVYYVSLMGMMMIFFVFVDFMENIRRITRHHARLDLIGLYYINLIPKLFVEMSWVAFLVAILFVIGSLVKNNEYTAMLAGGISIYNIGVPLLVIGLLLSLTVFCVQELIVPSGILQANEIDEGDFVEQPSARLIQDIAGVAKGSKFYFFDNTDIAHGILTGVHIYTKKGGSIVGRIDAEKAVWNRKNARWYLQNGVIRKFSSLGQITEDTPFSTMEAPFREAPKTLEVYSLGKGEMDFRELRYQIRNLEKSGYNAQRPKVEYQKKFAFPLANCIAVFLGLPFALERRRGGLTASFAFSVLAAFLYYGTFQIGLTLGKGGVLPAMLAAWLSNFLFLGIGIGLTIRART